ncbi:Mut7-C RNAse domain-containing protein [Candidatus Fermentibacteria bacterium]|nr:Mut7-C RNAse domain-containing protein [Candidatus Fermentibacteria bacterium]
MNDAGLADASPLVKAFATSPRFAADMMLGSLARWLRILGFDTVFGPDFDDDALIRQSNASGRILLTADRALASRPIARRAVLLPPSRLPEQWQALVRAMPLLPWVRPFTRCGTCNDPLRSLPRDRARDRVPPHIFDVHGSFLACPSCRRVYWPGTHRDHILGRVQRLGAAIGQCPEPR